ncbi:MAG TPA: hypothetical protein VD931_07615 [Baekduia sp.]|nr:hypothetical protein [Baekduia sp.]
MGLLLWLARGVRDVVCTCVLVVLPWVAFAAVTLIAVGAWPPAATLILGPAAAALVLAFALAGGRPDGGRGSDDGDDGGGGGGGGPRRPRAPRPPSPAGPQLDWDRFDDVRAGWAQGPRVSEPAAAPVSARG